MSAGRSTTMKMTLVSGFAVVTLTVAASFLYVPRRPSTARAS
jgi:hypothetical protein